MSQLISMRTWNCCGSRVFFSGILFWRIGCSSASNNLIDSSLLMRPTCFSWVTRANFVAFSVRNEVFIPWNFVAVAAPTLVPS